MQATVLQQLLAGEFICPIAFAPEYEQLQDEGLRAEVETWLDKLHMRLSRLGDDGAFFMAPAQLQPAQLNRVKDELLRFRDVYGPWIRMLNLIRQAKEGFNCVMGDYLQVAELETAINESATLETQLRSLHGVITNVAARHSNREFLKRLLEHLKSDGLLIVVNPQSETYQVTGKIDQLHAVLEFIAEHEAVITSAADDQRQEAETLDLLRMEFSPEDDSHV